MTWLALLRCMTVCWHSCPPSLTHCIFLTEEFGQGRFRYQNNLFILLFGSLWVLGGLMLEGWILCFYCWRCLLLVTIQQVSLSLLLFVLETHFSHGSFWGKPLKLACLAQSRALLTPASRGSAFTNSTENPPPSQLLVFNELGCTAWKCSSAECCDGFRKTTEGKKNP